MSHRAQEVKVRHLGDFGRPFNLAMAMKEAKHHLMRAITMHSSSGTSSKGGRGQNITSGNCSSSSNGGGNNGGDASPSSSLASSSSSGGGAVLTPEAFVSIARKVGYGSGQWTICPSSPQEADRLWVVIAMAVTTGMLGVSAKANAGVICVFADPLWDKREVDRVLSVLRRHCGIMSPLSFSSDMMVLLLGASSATLYRADRNCPISTFITTEKIHVTVKQRHNNTSTTSTSILHPNGSGDGGSSSSGAGNDGGAVSQCADNHTDNSSSTATTSTPSLADDDIKVAIMTAATTTTATTTTTQPFSSLTARSLIADVGMGPSAKVEVMNQTVDRPIQSLVEALRVNIKDGGGGSGGCCGQRRIDDCSNCSQKIKKWSTPMSPSSPKGAGATTTCSSGSSSDGFRSEKEEEDHQERRKRIRT